MKRALPERDLRWSVLLIAMAASFLTPFMGSSVNVALPSIGRDLGLGALAMGWVQTAFLLAAAMCLVPLGRLADIVGRRRIYTWGLALFTGASALCGLALSGETLIAFRILQGVGASMIFGTGTAMLISVFPPNERGKMLGINVAMVYFGQSVGPFVGGILTEHLGWRAIFFVIVPFGAAAVVLILWKIRAEWREARGERFDLAGSLVYGLGLLGLMYGFSNLPGAGGFALLAAGLLCLAGFVAWEIRTPEPVLDMRLFFGNRVFAFSNLAALASYSATFATGFLLSLYLQYVKGFSAQSAGFILVTQPVVQAVLSPLAGRLSDRVEPGIVSSAGMAVTVAGLTVFALLPADASLAHVVGGLALLGFGFALFSSPNANAIMGSVDRRFFGVASGAMGTMRLTGQMISMGVTLMIFALCLGATRITPACEPDLLKSMHIAFLVQAALCLGGIFASLARGRVR